MTAGPYRPQPGDTITHADPDERLSYEPFRVIAPNPDYPTRMIVVDADGDATGISLEESWVKVGPLPDIPERWINLYVSSDGLGAWTDSSSAGPNDLSRTQAVAVVHVGLRGGEPFAEIERVTPEPRWSETAVADGLDEGS